MRVYTKVQRSKTIVFNSKSYEIKNKVFATSTLTYGTGSSVRLQHHDRRQFPFYRARQMGQRPLLVEFFKDQLQVFGCPLGAPKKHRFSTLTAYHYRQVHTPVRGVSSSSERNGSSQILNLKKNSIYRPVLNGGHLLATQMVSMSMLLEFWDQQHIFIKKKTTNSRLNFFVSALY